MRIVVTGSKGLIGSHVLAYASLQPAIDVFGVDQIGMGNRFQNYLSADLSDFGQTVEALSGADAVIHLAAVRNYGMLPASRLFATNVTSTFNVLQAAVKLGIKRIVLASSIQVNRAGALRALTQYHYLPIDEAHPLDPQNEYGLSKQIGEVTADMFAKHYGLTILSLRFTWVMSPEEIRKQLPWEKAEKQSPSLYAYCDVRDAARACYLAATQHLPESSHSTLFVTARDTFVNVPSAEIVKRYFSDASICGLTGYDSLVNGNAARDLLGFVPEYSCRDQ